jgi:hypothetical protein
MIFKILIIAALIGASLSYFLNGKSKDSALEGAAGGILISTYVILQVLVLGTIALLGIWLIQKIF